jgi:hypothetical protein
MRKMGGAMLLIRSIPLLGLVIVAYNVIVFTGGQDRMDEILQATAFVIPLVKGDWTLRVSDATISVALIALFVEIVRSSGFGRTTITNHALSMVVFVVALIEFLVMVGFNTSTFFLITLMALIDVVGGFTISIITARRDIGIAGGTGTIDQL